MKTAMKFTGLVCGLAAVSNAEAMALPKYTKLFDLQAARDKHLPAKLETVHPELKMELVPEEQGEVARQSISPTVIEEPQMAAETETGFYGLSGTDWALFGTGLFLGLFITFATTGLASVFSPCVAQWAQVTATTYSFFVYMKIYEEKNFNDDTSLAAMVLNMVAWGDAINSGACSSGDQDINGRQFGLKVFNVHDFISFGHHTMDDEDAPTHPLYEQWQHFSQWIKPFGQSENSGEIADSDIWVAVGILGATQAIAAYADYMTFRDRWEAKQYFDSGTFLGKAIIEAFVVIYLIMLAQAATSNNNMLLF